jgi:penicillin-binding protein 1A
MLAGLPKAPGTNNPISNPKRARAPVVHPRPHGGKRLHHCPAGAGCQKRRTQAQDRPGRHARTCRVRSRDRAPADVRAVRQRDLHPRPERLHHGQVRDQDAAYKRCAAASWISNGARSTGPGKIHHLPRDPRRWTTPSTRPCWTTPDNGDVMSAVVLEADAEKIKAVRQNGEVLEITGDGLKPAQSGLSDKAPPNIKIRRGAVIRVAKTPKGSWEITQLPEVEGAFVAVDPAHRCHQGAGGRLRL